MKRMLAPLLALALTLSLTACGVSAFVDVNAME